MRYFLLFLAAALVFSCQENKRVARELKVYFDLDSLLDAQALALSRQGYRLVKAVEMGDNSEVDTLAYDSAGWAGEFRIMRDFDLNEPHNVGAYSENRSNEGTTFELKDETLDAPVKFFSVEKDGNRLEIRSRYFEDKVIYEHERNLRLVVEDGLLRWYRVEGFQKLTLGDTTKYTIGGEVLSID